MPVIYATRIAAIFFLLLFVVVEASGQEKRTYDIGMLVDEKAEDVAPILEALQQEILAVVGEDAEIRFSDSTILANGFDVATAAAQYQQLVDNETDIILAFGPANNAAIIGQGSYPIPTILFGAANLDLVEVDQTRLTSGIENFAYLITSQSYSRDLSTFRELVDFDTLGILLDARRADLSILTPLFDDLAGALGIAYQIVTYQSLEDLLFLPENINAVYLAEGFFLNDEEISELAEYLAVRQIPSFTNTPVEDVVLGLMATNQAEDNINQFLRRLALLVEGVVNGDDLADQPVYIEATQRLTMNWNTAERVGAPIRFSSIANTDFVGEFRNVISEETYSLVEILDELLAKNLGLQQARKEVDLAQQDVDFARSAYLPSVTANATGTYIDPETARLSNGQAPEYAVDGDLTVQQLIFSDASNLYVQIQENLRKAEEQNLTSIELDLVLNAANLYFNTLILKSNLQIQSENLNVTKVNLQIAEQNFEAGQAGRSDVLRFQSEMARNMQSLVEAVNGLEQGFLALNELLNNPLDREIDVEDAILSEGIFERYNYEEVQGFLDDPIIRNRFIDFLVEEAINNAPELRSLDYSREVIDRNILLNGSRRFLPTIAAQAQYNRTFDQWGDGVPPPEFSLNDNYNVGINVSIPIVDQNRKNINRQIAQIQKEQLELNEEATVLSIEKNVRDAVLDMINQTANIQLSQVAENAALESLELTQTAYSNGAVNLVQLLDAQNNLLQAQLSRANASYNYLISGFILERYIGYYFFLHTEEENQAFVNRFLSTGVN